MYVVDFLRSRRVWFETFFHRPASSATRLAGCVHVSGRSVAKSVLVKAGEDFVLAVLPATSRVDLDGLGARVAGCDRARSAWRHPRRSAASSRIASREPSPRSAGFMD